MEAKGAKEGRSMKTESGNSSTTFDLSENPIKVIIIFESDCNSQSRNRIELVVEEV